MTRATTDDLTATSDEHASASDEHTSASDEHASASDEHTSASDEHASASDEHASASGEEIGASDEPRPYSDDLDYITHEVEWVEARSCLRIAEFMSTRMPRAHYLRRRWRDEPDDEEDARAYWEKQVDNYRAQAPEIRAAIDARRAATRAAGRELALDRICERFGLDEFERNILLLATVRCFSRRLGARIEDLDDDGCSLTTEGAMRFQGFDDRARIERRSVFSADSPLRRHDLVTLDVGRREVGPEEFLHAHVSITARTFDAIVGLDGASSPLRDFSSLETPLAGLDDVVLPADDRARILSIIDNHERVLELRRTWGLDDVVAYGRGALMLFYGPPGTGKTMTAHGVAAHLGKRVLNVDVPTFVENMQANRFLPGLFREARLQDAVLFFDECETLFGARREGNTLMTMLLTELERFEGIAVLATNLPGQLDEALERRMLLKVHFAKPDTSARIAIWERHLPEAMALDEDVDTEVLAREFDIAGGHIKNAVLAGIGAAVQESPDAPVVRHAHLAAAARAQCLQPSEGASRLTPPRASLDDVVLERDVLSEVQYLIAAARHRRTVLDAWGVGGQHAYGRSVSALLAGPPGTGKTLCAEAIAGELGRPLMRVTAAQVLSKWVGESESRLLGVFSEARARNAVLFFDEVDSLLQARGAGQRRYELSQVNTLLAQVEQHDGVVLMASNHADLLDPALRRRLTAVLELELPGSGARARIWRICLPEAAPLADDVDVTSLADRYALTGAEIRNAALRVATAAAEAGDVITQSALERAAAQTAGERAVGSIGFAA